MKPRRILLLVHPKFRPDKLGSRPAGTEFDVWRTLRQLGHTVEIGAAEFDLRRFDRQILQFRPEIVFNLLEEFRGEGIFDFHLVTYLESLGIPYTGCNPRGLIVSRDKLWVSQIADGLGVRVPKTTLATSRERRRQFPVFLKLNREDASLGISKSNVIRTPKQFQKQLQRLRGLGYGEVLQQSFVPGQEVTVSAWGNGKLEVFAPWRLHLPHEDDVATTKIKFDAGYRRKIGVRATKYSGPWIGEMQSAALRMYKALDLSGYARFDFRIHRNEGIHLIDVNANPNLAKDEDFAMSARKSDYAYEDVVSRVIEFGMNY